MPKFLFEDVEILDIKKMGKHKEFTKLIVSNNITTLDVVIFVDFKNKVKISDKISFVATLSKNEFRGNISFNLMFKELL